MRSIESNSENRVCGTALASAWLLALSLASPPAPAVQDILGHGPVPKDKISDPTPGRFSVCYQYTCAQVEHLSLSDDQWQLVRGFFTPPAATAQDERDQIAAAIAHLEVEIGREIGTLDDVGGSFQGVLKAGNQLDCIDESTNSTTYLTMMAKDGLLRYHRVEPTANRVANAFLPIGWPHTTAVVLDTTTGEKWAVDSWFLDNGEPPSIVPLSDWRAGWEPGH